jgi:hypothetical protein
LEVDQHACRLMKGGQFNRSPSTVAGNRADCGLGLIKEEIRDASGPNCGPENEDQLKSDTRARLPCDEPSPFFRSFDKPFILLVNAAEHENSWITRRPRIDVPPNA